MLRIKRHLCRLIRRRKAIPAWMIRSRGVKIPQSKARRLKYTTYGLEFGLCYLFPVEWLKEKGDEVDGTKR